MNWKQKINAVFLYYVELAVKYPLRCLLLPGLFFIFMLVQLASIKQDSAFESFFDPESQLYLNFTDFRQTFGRDEFYLLLVETDDLYQEDFLQGFKALHESLSLIPRVATVDSLVNARFIQAEDDELLIEELLEEVPSTAEGMRLLQQAIADNPVYQRRLISDNQHSLAMMVTLEPYKLIELADGTQRSDNFSPSELADILHRIKTIVKEQGAFSKSIKVGGAAAIGVELNQAVEKDFGIFTSTSIVLIVIFLSLMFRRVSGVVLPMLVISCGLVITMGMMAVLDYPIQVTTAILPSFLLAVCVGDSVHLLSYFYRHYDSNGNKHEALLAAVEHTGLPMLFTSLTTGAGLISFAYADLIPVASLGLFGAIGAIVAFVSTMIILPPLIALLPLKRKNMQGSSSVENQGSNDMMQRFLQLMVNLVLRFPSWIVGISLSIFIAGFWAATQIPFSNDAMQWFDPEVEVRQSIQAAEKVLAGSNAVEIVIDTGVTEGALDPAIWAKIDPWLMGLTGKEIMGIPIGSVTSLATLIKETNRALHDNDPAYYVIPDNRELIAQELLMVEMDQTDELYKFTDDQKRLIRITLIIPWIDSILFPDLVAEIEQQYKQEVGLGADIDDHLNITGMSVILGQFFTQMISQIVTSYALALGVITIMMVLLLGNLKLGLLSMLPNLLPLLSLMGIMWLFDFNLDMFTMLIGSIAIGLSVDDTIHFMHGYRSQLQKHQNVEKAISEAILTTGRALVTTSLVLCFGFLTFALSSLSNLFNFGVLTAACCFIALFADLLLAPALLLLVYRRKPVAEDESIKDDEVALISSTN